MKRGFAVLLGGLIALSSNFASAGIVQVLTFNRLMDSFGETQLVTHTVPSDNYVSGTVVVGLEDDTTDVFFTGETAFVFNLFDVANSTSGSANYTFSLGALSIAVVNLIETYSYTVTRLSGDFYLRTSTLSLETASVPEPGSLVLLGAGLLGFTLLRRRRSNA